MENLLGTSWKDLLDVRNSKNSEAEAQHTRVCQRGITDDGVGITTEDSPGASLTNALEITGAVG